ncbi:hypothetical protein JVU11DRAFT_2261 [Chiua virens]|nr:hypothetical protein JVU11DRAFT_2261 [Chiua virens]
MSRANQNTLMECEIMNIPPSLETTNPSGEGRSYVVFAFEPGKGATISLIGDELSAHWTVGHPAVTLQLSNGSPGTQLFIALLDASGASREVLPTMYTVQVRGIVWSGPSDLLPLEATQLEISTSLFGRLMPCRPWEPSVSGEELEPMYSDSTIASEYGDFLSSEERNFGTGKALSRLRVGMACFARWVLAVMVPARSKYYQIVDQASWEDRLFAFPNYVLQHLAAAAFPINLWKQNRDSVTIDSSHSATIIVAVCVSLGGIGMMVMAIFVIVKCRRTPECLGCAGHPSKAIRDHCTSADKGWHDDDNVHYPYCERPPERSVTKAGGDATKVGRTHASRGQRPQDQALHRRRRQPLLHIPSLARVVVHAYNLPRPTRHCARITLHPPSYHSSSHTPTSVSHPHSHSQFGSGVDSGSSSTHPIEAPSDRRAAGVSTSRSAADRERRSAKHALWLSRSAGELYRTTSEAPRSRVPECDTHPEPYRFPRRQGQHGGRGARTDTFSPPTNHLRHWHSASSMVPVERGHLEVEEAVDAGGVVFQHQDAGRMQELPPPYHKLVLSSSNRH